LLSACSEACETGNEKGVGVWHAISKIVDNIDRSFLYGFCLICLAILNLGDGKKNSRSCPPNLPPLVFSLII